MIYSELNTNIMSKGKEQDDVWCSEQSSDTHNQWYQLYRTIKVTFKTDETDIYAMFNTFYQDLCKSDNPDNPETGTSIRISVCNCLGMSLFCKGH